MAGEVDLIRETALPYCKGHGLDLGCGFNKVTQEAWGLDLRTPYTELGNDTIELIMDAEKLEHIRANSLDYIFSSHLLEDFEDTRKVLWYWLSCLKIGGYLILYLPNQQLYRAHCESSGVKSNPTHKIDNMSLEYIKDIIDKGNWSNSLTIVEEIPHHAIYSFFIVIQKGDKL